MEAYENAAHLVKLLRSDDPIQPHERRDIAALLESQAREIAEWRDCAMYGVTMEGPKPNGWRRSALERCRRRYIDRKDQS